MLKHVFCSLLWKHNFLLIMCLLCFRECFLLVEKHKTSLIFFTLFFSRFFYVSFRCLSFILPFWIIYSIIKYVVFFLWYNDINESFFILFGGFNKCRFFVFFYSFMIFMIGLICNLKTIFTTLYIGVFEGTFSVIPWYSCWISNWNCTKVSSNVSQFQLSWFSLNFFFWKVSMEGTKIWIIPYSDI